VNTNSSFDLILQGATGFTGQLAAKELALRAPQGLHWAIAGRNRTRVDALAQKLGVPGLVADGLDPMATDALAAQTRVILSCAGPFSRYGTLLVKACVQHGTHYADLTGELPWIQQVIAEHHQACVATGTTLIPASGFDSVPADLGVLAMRQKVGGDVPIQGFFHVRGGLNGGTLRSGMALAEQGQLKSEATADATGAKVFFVPSLQRWAAPFLMAPVNESVVARTATLIESDSPGASPGTPYREYLLIRSCWKAHLMAAMLTSSHAMLNARLGRKLLRRFGPKPGEGPSEESMHNGFATLTLLAESLEAPLATLRWRWKGDPSNTITVHCLVQTGLALAAGEAQRAGVLTPASALGTTLFARLEKIGAVQS
jgi:short subunit dehydrogenase-like uncharacterized protein